MAEPLLNLIVLRTADIEASRAFYASLRIIFQPERHGHGPEHFAADINGVIFELYPQSQAAPASDAIRLGFTVQSLTDTILDLENRGVPILSPARVTCFGQRAVVLDPDGRQVELRQAGPLSR